MQTDMAPQVIHHEQHDQQQQQQQQQQHHERPPKHKKPRLASTDSNDKTKATSEFLFFNDPTMQTTGAPTVTIPIQPKREATEFQEEMCHQPNYSTSSRASFSESTSTFVDARPESRLPGETFV